MQLAARIVACARREICLASPDGDVSLASRFCLHESPMLGVSLDQLQVKREVKMQTTHAGNLHPVLKCLGAFLRNVVVGAASGALWLITPAHADLNIPYAPSSASSSDFDRLAAAPNVVRALRGNEPGFVNNDPRAYWLPEGSMNGSKTRPVYDAQVGGLRFDIVPVPQLAEGAGDYANIAGSFYFNFGKHFGPKQKFRVRWQQMFNEPMARTRLLNYTAIKQAIIGSGDRAGLPPQSSCTLPDIVVTTYAQFRFAHAYHSCGRYWGLYGTPSYAFQNQVPQSGPYCNYDATAAQARTGDIITPPPACVGWPIMQWQDYALEVENGDIVAGTGQYAYSVVRIYIGLNADGSLHLAHEWDSRTLPATSGWKGLGLFVGNASNGEQYFGKFWGTPYMTGYRGGHTQTMQTWYRNFIVTDESLPAAPVVTSPVPEAIAKLPANGALDLGNYKWTDTGGHSNGYLVTDYSGMVYAPGLKSMLVLGGGHASTDYDAVNTFSMRTLNWRELYSATPGSLMTPNNYDKLRGAWLSGPSGPYPRPVARHTLDEMVVVGDELIVLAGVEGNGVTAGSNWPGGHTGYNMTTPGRVAHLNLKTLQWTFAPDDFGASDYNAAEYDPPSGKVIMLGTRGLFVYDPISKKKTLAINFLSYPGAYQVRDERDAQLASGALSYNQNLVYYPPNGRHYYIVSGPTPVSTTGAVFELELNRQDFSKSVVRRVASAPITGGATKFAYDSRNLLIGGGLSNGVFYAYDPRVRSWAAKNVSGPRSIAFMAMDYDAESNAYMLVTPDRRSWAYRWQ
jgi:hypothetical protein